MIDEEIWRPTEGYPGYEVSNLGNVRSLDRCVPRKDHFLNIKGRQLRLIFICTNGYYRVHLSRPVLVHRLVAMAFCDGYKNGLQVNHKNGIRTDNNSKNLEWVTASQNIKHSFDVLGRTPSTLGTIGETAHASKAIESTDPITGVKRRWACAMDASREGFNNTAISACCHGARRHHKGLHWSFVDN